jgi:maltose O-acetyltransferase
MTMAGKRATAPVENGARRVTPKRLGAVARDELSGIDWHVELGRILTAPLPPGAAARLRSRLLRAAGFDIGPRTLIMSRFTLIGGREASRHLTIGADCFINQECVFDATARITIGNNVAFGHGVLITTSSHAIGWADRRSGLLTPIPVTVGDGAWLSSRAVILPGVDVGEGAVVAAGAVVTRSVPPHSLVGGVPARVVKELDQRRLSEWSAGR